MPRYFFTLEAKDRRDPDTTGTVFPDPKAAIQYANRIVRELKEDGDYAESGATLVVLNEARETLFEISL